MKYEIEIIQSGEWKFFSVLYELWEATKEFNETEVYHGAGNVRMIITRKGV